MVFFFDQIFHSLTQCEIEQRSQFQNGAVRPNSGGSKRERRRSNLADIQVGWFVSVMLNDLLLIEHHDYGCHDGGDENSHSVGRVTIKLQRNPSESCGGGRRQGRLSPFIISTTSKIIILIPTSFSFYNWFNPKLLSRTKPGQRKRMG